MLLLPYPSMWRTLLLRLFDQAYRQNEQNICRLLEQLPAGGAVCDLGSDDGIWTARVAQVARAGRVVGYEIVPAQAAKAEQRGISVSIGDLNNPWPFANNSFDIVHANQVIEHVYDTDHFVRETHRVLKRGGVAIISTENLASWHNIGALLFGWQPFSSTNISAQTIGNPLAVWRGRVGNPLRSWQHQRLFSYRGLKELFLNHTFQVERIVGAGYYPLPAVVGTFEPRHSHFVTVQARKL